MNSSDTKYRLLISPYPTIYDYRSIEDNLTSMAAKGWRTENVDAFLWKFKKAEPSNKKFSAIFTGSEKTELLEELCEKEGWKKEFQWKHMQIFYADQDAIPLETDEAVKLENIHRNMKQTFIPNWIKILLFMLVLAFINGMKYFNNSPYSDGLTFWAFLIALYGALIAGITLLGYLLWLKISRKRISEGGVCAKATLQRKFINILLIGFLALCIGGLADANIHFGKGIVLYIVIYLILVLAVVSIINQLSKQKERKILFGIITLVLIIGLVVFMNIIEKILIT
jgi:hypothetical protein